MIKEQLNKRIGELADENDLLVRINKQLKKKNEQLNDENEQLKKEKENLIKMVTNGIRISYTGYIQLEKENELLRQTIKDYEYQIKKGYTDLTYEEMLEKECENDE